jgi:MFS family permease
MSEIFERKRVLLAIILIFLVGSIMCTRSMSIEMLVASRAIQGVGGRGLLTLVEVIMTDMVPIADPLIATQRYVLVKIFSRNISFCWSFQC